MDILKRMYSNIVNPINGLYVKVSSKQGKKILDNYINVLIGGTKNGAEEKNAPLISAKQEEPISVEVIDTFIKSLAELLSDLALTFNTGNGILLAGSLMRSLYPMMDKDNFYKSFLNNKKEIHKDMLDLVSIGVITKKRTPLYGNLSFYKKLKK